VPHRRLTRGPLLLLLLAACGPSPHTYRVSIHGMAFDPADLTVNVGDRIEWTNDDMVPHTATAAGLFDSGPIAVGGHYRTTATRSGRVPYICTLHTTMQGAFTVR
jgi:plastocyanin